MVSARIASISVWLPGAAHAQLARAAASEDLSLPLLARRAAARGVQSVDGRVEMPAPSFEAVERLRAAGYGLNRLLPALGAATTEPQEAAIVGRLKISLNGVSDAARKMHLQPPPGSPKTCTLPAADNKFDDRWKLVRVTTDTDTAQRWEQVAQAAGFRSTANWVRDALAGSHGLPIARPPATSTIDARVVSGRVQGLLAQTEALTYRRPIHRANLRPYLEAADAAVWASLDSILAWGGHPKARR